MNIQQIKNQILKLPKLFQKRNMTVSNAFLYQNYARWDTWEMYELVKKGYTASTWVYSAITLIAKNIASVPFHVYDKEKNIIENHYLEYLLKTPSPFMSQQNFFELLVIFLELSGRAPIFKNKVMNKTKELILISPDRIQAVQSKNNENLIAYYEIINNDGQLIKSNDFNLENVIYLRYPDPANPVDGISPLEVAIRAVDIDSELQNYGKSNAQNMGVVNGLITIKQDMTPAQKQAAKEALSDSLETGKRKGIPAVLTGQDIGYTRLGLDSNEISYLETRRFSREEILSAFGVPPQVLGYDGTIKYDNFISGQKILWENTLIPILKDIQDALNHGLKNELGNFYIAYDLSNVQALKENERNKAEMEKIKADTAKLYFDMGMPFEEINRKLNLGVEEFDNWERPFAGRSNQSDSQQILEKKKPTIPIDIRAKENILENPKEYEVTKMFSDRMMKIFDLQAMDIYGVIKRGKNVEANIGLVLEKYNHPIENVLAETYPIAIKKLGKQDVVFQRRSILMNQRSLSDADIEQAMQEVLDEANFILQERALIQGATLVVVLDAVEKGLMQGLSMNAIALQLTESGAFNPERALRIARTETATAQSIASLTNAKKLGATHKTWNASAGARKLHSARSGITVPINAAFSLGVRFPGDPVAKAADRINCRCALTYSIDEDTQKLLDLEQKFS